MNAIGWFVLVPYAAVIILLCWSVAEGTVKAQRALAWWRACRRGPVPARGRPLNAWESRKLRVIEAGRKKTAPEPAYGKDPASYRRPGA